MRDIGGNIYLNFGASAKFMPVVSQSLWVKKIRSSELPWTKIRKSNVDVGASCDKHVTPARTVRSYNAAPGRVELEPPLPKSRMHWLRSWLRHRHQRLHSSRRTRRVITNMDMGLGFHRPFIIPVSTSPYTATSQRPPDIPTLEYPHQKLCPTNSASPYTKILQRCPSSIHPPSPRHPTH